MMNERGKSDPAVVATKPANKAEQSAAEPVEPRAGTKGNANQQHTGRTQSRETCHRCWRAYVKPQSGLPSLTRGRSRMRGKPHVRIWCSEASCHSSGRESRQQRSPVAVELYPATGRVTDPL